MLFRSGLEMVVSLGAALIISIVVANVIGKVRLGPYVYVGWLTNITAGVGGNGLSVTVRKYMAEYLNRGEGSIAHAIYSYALRLQTLIAIALIAVGLPLALLEGKPGYRVVSALLVMSMAPRMIACIPSQANMAGERLQRNTGPALLGGAIGVSLTLFSLWMGWGLRGIAFSFALGCTVEAVGKFYSVRRWLGPLPTGTISPELKKRMSSYSGQGLVLMVLNIVVWDRSDILNMMTRSWGYSRRTRRRVSRPSISGISISNVRTSGLNCGIRCSAIAPFDAAPTTSSAGFCSRA